MCILTYLNPPRNNNTHCCNTWAGESRAFSTDYILHIQYTYYLNEISAQTNYTDTLSIEMYMYVCMYVYRYICIMYIMFMYYVYSYAATHCIYANERRVFVLHRTADALGSTCSCSYIENGYFFLPWYTYCI